MAISSLFGGILGNKSGGNAGGKHRIDFDDGDTRWLDEADIRPIASESKAGIVPRPGDLVWAQWAPNAWYHGRVERITAVGLYIVFDDGDEADVAIALTAVDREPAKGSLALGMRVVARWTDDRFYPGTIDEISQS